MRTRLISAAIGLVLVGVATAEPKLSLAGSKAWTVVKSEEAPPGTQIAFAADGKVTVTIPVDGKPRVVSGTYTFAGDQLTLRLSHDGRERVEARTSKLTDTVHTEGKNKKLEELPRKPSGSSTGHLTPD